jgi:hypothetical protein
MIHRAPSVLDGRDGLIDVNANWIRARSMFIVGDLR